MPESEELHPALVNFGRAVSTFRKKRKISQEELGAEAELDRTYIGVIERGERNPTILSALRIAKALGTTVAKLCERVEG